MTEEGDDQNNNDFATYDEVVKTLVKLKRQMIVYGLVAFFIIAFGIWQWYDLTMIEEGLKQGSISSILYKVYEIAGKWGVASVYWIIGLWVVYLSYGRYRVYKDLRNEISKKE